MGTIYRNGVPFVGSGGAGGVEMTMAEYELLPESEKMNGAIYFITDGNVSYPSASQMRYDNTESQIPSTTVQGAIDENRIEINDLKSGFAGYMDWSNFTCTSGSWNGNTGNTSTGVTPAGVTATNWYNLTLDVAGTYLLCYTATFDDQSNTSGVRGMRYIVNESSIDEIFVAPPSQYTTISGFKRIKSNGSTNVRMGLYQNTGSSMAVNNISINAIYLGSR